MAIILTLVNNLIMFLGVELFVFMRWGTNANIILVSFLILYIAFTVFTILKWDIVVNHLLIANLTMPVVLFLVIAIVVS
jgi:hypothetical protein